MNGVGHTKSKGLVFVFLLWEVAYEPLRHVINVLNPTIDARD
jgi:hypothetical protein